MGKNDAAEKNRELVPFRQEFAKIAVPVALQSVLESSFSMIDQIMVGQLGETGIAGIGLAGKFSSLYATLVAALAAVAGVMLAQYVGKKNETEVAKSFYLNLIMALGLAGIFWALSTLMAQPVMGLYTSDAATRAAAVTYLRIVAFGYPARAFSLLCATLLRCRGHAAVPLYASAAGTVVHTALSYGLIFGKFGLPQMGIAGAASATAIAQGLEFAVIFVLYLRMCRQAGGAMPLNLAMTREQWVFYIKMLFSVLLCDFLWSLGENVYATVYGHLGTDACAAMTLIGPLIALFMGLMGGVSAAAGIMIGKRLGAQNYDSAYAVAKRLLVYGVAGALALDAVLLLCSRFYIGAFRVDAGVRAAAFRLLIVFAVYAPVKVENMILGVGIVRSGGKPLYAMLISIIGTWCVGVPLSLLASYVLHWSIVPVYALLSLEEVVRMLLNLYIFKSKHWMQRL